MSKIFKSVTKGLSVALICGVISCGGNTQSVESEAEAMSEEVSVADSVAAEGSDSIADLPPDTVNKNPGIVERIRYTTAEAALEFMNNSPHAAAYQAGILPRMARDNIAYCSKLLNNHYDYFIVVDKDKMKVILFDKYGRVFKQYPMAGSRCFGTKHKKADSRTPEGFFKAGLVYDSQEWEYTDDNGVKHPGKGVFGPKFIRVTNPVTTQIGIHGTSSPGSIGRRTSHGCIRLQNANILDLVKYVRTGMPIIINPGERDRAVNAREGVHIPSIETGVERYSSASKGTMGNSKVTVAPVVKDSVKSVSSADTVSAVSGTPADKTKTPVPAEPTAPADTVAK